MTDNLLDLGFFVAVMTFIAIVARQANKIFGASDRENAR